VGRERDTTIREGRPLTDSTSNVVDVDFRRAPAAPLIEATPFEWTDPALIPPRKWIYGNHYIRQFITETIAPGGYGKSSLAITEGIAIATGARCSELSRMRAREFGIGTAKTRPKSCSGESLPSRCTIAFDPPSLRGVFL
jgi:hypothetical protein